MNAIYNEDCNATMRERIPKNSLHLVFTSPPYYNAKDYSQWKSVGDYMWDMEEIFHNVYQSLKPSRFCIINVSPMIIPRKKRSEQSHRIPLPSMFTIIMMELGFEFYEDIVWLKPEGSARNRNGGFHQHRKPCGYKPNTVTENVLVFKKPAPFLLDKVLREYPDNILKASLVEDGYERSDVWKINPETKSKHPAPFPKALAERVIRYYSYVGDTVYDPFCGSGTTCVVAKELGRNYLGSEIHEEYCELSNVRLNNK